MELGVFLSVVFGYHGGEPFSRVIGLAGELGSECVEEVEIL